MLRRSLGLLVGLVVIALLGIASGCGDQRQAPAEVVTEVAATTPAGPDYTATAMAALDRLMDQYQTSGPSAGRLLEPWWTTATTIDGVIHAEQLTGDRRYVADIVHTYDTNRDVFGADFKNHYFDDSGWWGLTWLHGYQLTGDRRMLATAQDIDDYMASAWSSTCGGGVVWALSLIKHGDQKNAITNEIYLQLSSELSAVAGNKADQSRAEAEWRWFRTSGLIRSDGLVTDQLSPDCRPASIPLTYTQGPILAGLLSLSRVEPGLVTEARRLADASTTSRFLNPGGILREPCEPNCEGGVDGDEFKGSYAQPLGDLNAALPGHPYTRYLDRQVASILAHDQYEGSRFGGSFAGPPGDPTTVRQYVAFSMIAASLPRR